MIPTLLYEDFGLVKGVRFDSRRAVGSAMQADKVYNLRGWTSSSSSTSPRRCEHALPTSS